MNVSLTLRFHLSWSRGKLQFGKLPSDQNASHHLNISGEPFPETDLPGFFLRRIWEPDVRPVRADVLHLQREVAERDEGPLRLQNLWSVENHIFLPETRSG